MIVSCDGSGIELYDLAEDPGELVDMSVPFRHNGPAAQAKIDFALVRAIAKTCHVVLIRLTSKPGVVYDRFVTSSDYCGALSRTSTDHPNDQLCGSIHRSWHHRNALAATIHTILRCSGIFLYCLRYIKQVLVDGKQYLAKLFGQQVDNDS